MHLYAGLTNLLKLLQWRISNINLTSIWSKIAIRAVGLRIAG